MNRRNLLAAFGAGIAWLFGIRPKKAEAESDRECVSLAACYDKMFGDLDVVGGFSNLPYTYTIKVEHSEGEPLQLWLTDQFYVDLPEDRYKDSVDIDWAVAKEWVDGPWAGRFVAQCRVRPNSSMDWELFLMERVERESDDA